MLQPVPLLRRFRCVPSSRRARAPEESLSRPRRGHRVKHPGAAFVIKYFDLIDEFIKVRSCSEEVIAELQRQGVEAETFQQAIERLEETPAKLRQLAALYATYRQRVAALKLCDADDRLTVACEILRRHARPRPLE